MAGLILSHIFNVSRIFGLFPFDNRFVFSKTWFIYSLLLQIISSTFTYYSVGFMIQFSAVVTSSSWKALLLVEIIDKTNTCMMELATRIYFACKRDSLFEVFNSINDIITEHGEFSKRLFRFVHGCLLVIFLILIITILFFPFPLITQVLIILYLFVLNAASKACIVGQVWDVMHALKKIIRDNSKLFQDYSINRLECFSSFGESIGEIYAPLLMMTIASCFSRSIVDCYILISQTQPMILLNVTAAISVLQGIIYVTSIVYSYGEFINQVIFIFLFKF